MNNGSTASNREAGKGSSTLLLVKATMLIGVLVASFVLVFTPNLSHKAYAGTPTITWTGADDLRWSNPANWNPQRLPTGTDQIEIPTISGEVGGGTRFVGQRVTIDIDVGLDASGTLDIANRMQLDVEEGHILVNAGSISIEGLLFTLRGEIKNLGYIYNNGPGEGRDSTGIAVLDGIITNYGTINNARGIEIQNGGFLSGAALPSTTTTGYISNRGTITNSGTLSNVDGSTIDNLEGGTITNNAGGEIANIVFNSGNGGSTITNTGTINNNAGGSIFNNCNNLSSSRCPSTITNGGTINNAGYILNVTPSDTINNVGSGTITNTGKIDDQGIIVNTGTINNNAGGSILNDCSNFPPNNNGYAACPTTFTNKAGAKINNGGAITNTAGNIIDNQGNIVNSGTIDNSGTIKNPGVITNHGTINNIDGPGTIDNSGAISNYGTINNPSGATISNTGSIINYAGSTFTNSGTLTGNQPVAGTPVASDQSVTTNQNTPIPITLSATDPNGDPMTYSIVTNPSHGALNTFNPSTGTLIYAPIPSYFGPDSFTFKATDNGGADRNTATVSITVKGPPDCNNPTIVGTNGNDVLRGTPGDDVINALGGNDIVHALNGGNDEICGGDGNDVINSGDGNDRINGGAGREVINGGAGNNQIYGLEGNDVINSGVGNDLIDGGPDNDVGNAGPGIDKCFNVEIPTSCEP